jgi:hypothetical protein
MFDKIFKKLKDETKGNMMEFTKEEVNRMIKCQRSLPVMNEEQSKIFFVSIGCIKRITELSEVEFLNFLSGLNEKEIYNKPQLVAKYYRFLQGVKKK